MTAQVSSSYASQLVLAKVDKYKKRPGGPIKANQSTHAWLGFVDQIRKYENFGASETETIKEMQAPTASTWTGDATLPAATTTRDLKQVSFIPFNLTDCEKIIVDEFASEGIYLRHPSAMPNTNQRIISDNPQGDWVKINKMLDDRIESLYAKVETALADQYLGFKQSSTDCVGLFSMFPFVMTGNYGGLSRQYNPSVQHNIAMGSNVSGNANLGSATNIKGTVVTGAPGTTTFFSTVKGLLRQAKMYAGTSGLKGGKWRCFAGGAALDSVENIYRLANLQFNADSARSGGKVDLMLADSDLMIGRIEPEYEPDFARGDTLYSSLKPRGIGQAIATFSGGTGGTVVPTGVVNVSSSGTVTSISLTNPGAGYTAAPTIAITTGGTGSSATAECTVYSASSGSGLTQVDADDARIGQVATITITNAGSSYNVPGLINFDNLLVFVYEPAWEAMSPHKDLDRTATWVPDGRHPNAEIQVHHRGMLKCVCPRTVLFVAMP